jgi:hypothetical protein
MEQLALLAPAPLPTPDPDNPEIAPNDAAVEAIFSDAAERAPNGAAAPAKAPNRPANKADSRR